MPLEDDSVDIAVFCLALMGTNVTDFITEANRVLKERYVPVYQWSIGGGGGGLSWLYVALYVGYYN